MRYIGGRVEPDLVAMDARLQALRARDATFERPYGSMPCFHRESGLLVGVGLLKPIPDARDVPGDDIEIGWHVRRSHWNQGYATEIGRALVELGQRTVGLDELHVVVEPPNTASVAVARKLGARERGLTTRFYGGRSLVHLVVTAGDQSADAPA